MPVVKVLLSEHWTIVNDLPLFYRSTVDAAPADATPIVHVHGFGISGSYMVPTAELLSSFHPTFVPDLPGYGRSRSPQTTQTIPELAHSLASFLDAVGVERAIFVGNSMGCLIILEFAHAYPDRIERAVLVSPAGGPNNQPLYRGLTQLAKDSVREPAQLLPVAFPDYVRFGPLNSLRLFHAMSRYPTVEMAMRLDLPILIVAGVRDPLVSRERMQDLVEIRPNVSLEIHDRAAHAINFSHPETLALFILAWLGHPPSIHSDIEQTPAPEVRVIQSIENEQSR